jgi:U2-associated protein SR140
LFIYRSFLKQKSLDDQKLNHFALGSTRKSKREKEREAQEAKSREEKDLTAKAYEDFLETFDSEGASRSKDGPGFVRQGTGGSYGPKIRGRGAMNAQASELEQVGGQ